MATDDEIIRKRLLIDGEGAGDDRRITTLLKTFLKWCNSTGAEEDDSDTTYQKMLVQLAQCEFAIGKTQTVFEMNELETENYEKIYSEIEQSISNAYEEIASCKTELQQAKRIRRNRQEYDALAKVISQHPERQETLKQIEELDKELNSLTNTKESLFSKLEIRQKQFHLLINTIHELQRMLDEDKTDSDAEPSSGAEGSSMDTS
ncbi:THO complex subunit 7 [Desmophyllum pertusum]|uniref:THO complex subunit 7 n=1 Tax=Desmophyllum pertusum TaxID=174260 RepID=A0A9X0CZM0_9CNID|nr:THO complex subunit 7 [Desmophyllum pertusum]